jgi:hypothetical protein
LTVGTIAVFVLFAQQVTRDWLVTLFSSAERPVRVLYVVALTAFLLLVWRLSRSEPVRVVVAVVASVVGLTALGSVASSSLNRAATETSAEAEAVLGTERTLSPRNVYYVVLDGYAGGAALKRYLGHDIGSFLEEMRSLEFFSADAARSNYVTTHLAMIGTLEADYPIDETSPPFTDRRAFFPQAMRLGRQPGVVGRLLSGGHDFIHIGNRWAQCRTDVGIQCLGANRNSSFQEVMGVFLSPTKVPLKRIGLARPIPTALASFESGFEGVASSKSPYFVFVHELAPHPPYWREDCSVPSAGLLGQQSDEAGREGYVRTIDCLNKEIVRIARWLVDTDPEAVIVFQADHGSDFGLDWSRSLSRWDDAAVDQRTSILNLIRVPDGCRQWLRPTLSPINTMRLVMACLENRPPDYLPERTMLTTYETNVDFGLAHDAAVALARLEGEAGEDESLRR